MRELLTCCCGNRSLAPRLNRTAGVQLGSSRRVGPAPRARLEPPSTPSPGHALAPNLGTYWYKVRLLTCTYRTRKYMLIPG